MIPRQGAKTILDHNTIPILYEDNHLLVVHKPEHVLSQDDGSGRPDILNLMKTNLKERYQKTGNVYLGLVHRLDYPVSGIMVLAKTSKAASRLSKEIREHRFKKTYLAVVEGLLERKSGTFEDKLTKDHERNQVFTMDEQDNEYGKIKLAKLHYRVLDEAQGKSLVEIDLVSGRSHQIRVQFASRNHPLVGDSRYGHTQNRNDAIALLAYELAFMHPTRDEQMTLRDNISDNKVWQMFNWQMLKVADS